jgi:hypothetical protein
MHEPITRLSTGAALKVPIRHLEDWPDWQASNANLARIQALLKQEVDANEADIQAWHANKPLVKSALTQAVQDALAGREVPDNVKEVLPQEVIRTRLAKIDVLRHAETSAEATHRQAVQAATAEQRRLSEPDANRIRGRICRALLELSSAVEEELALGDAFREAGMGGGVGDRPAMIAIHGRAAGIIRDVRSLDRRQFQQENADWLHSK